MMIKTAAHFMTDPFTIDSPNFNHNGGRYVLSKNRYAYIRRGIFGVKENNSVKLYTNIFEV